jgi:hypothetical protein
MAYQLKSKSGQPIKKDGAPVMGADLIGIKIEQLDDANLTFVAVASTEDEDRDKDVLRQNGWDLKNFKKNPVIPWSHNYWELPVAKSMRTWVDSTNKRLLFKPKFDGNDDFSKKIFNKYANGFLTSFSVGFRGIESTPRDEANPWFGGKEFTKMELLEVSAVAVPANPNANVNLSFEEAGMVKSMLDIGYPEYFSRRKDNWLFYPIRDVGQFASPKQVPIDGVKGAFAIVATAIDEEHPEGKKEVAVGYSFDPTEFDKDLAIDFAKEFGDKTAKTYYYQVQFEDEKGISVEPKIEDVEITYSVDYIKDFEWADPNVVHGYSYRVYNTDKVKIAEELDKLPEVAPVEDKKDVDGCVDDPPTPPEPGEEFDKKLEELKSGFKKEIDNLIVVIDTMSKAIEKLVVKQEELCHNKIEPVIEDTTLEFDDEEQVQDKDGVEDLEVIETPSETVDDKTSSDSTIEIDEAELKEVGEMCGVIMSGLKDNLKKHLTEVVNSSGKID